MFVVDISGNFAQLRGEALSTEVIANTALPINATLMANVAGGIVSLHAPGSVAVAGSLANGPRTRVVSVNNQSIKQSSKNATLVEEVLSVYPSPGYKQGENINILTEYVTLRAELPTVYPQLKSYLVLATYNEKLDYRALLTDSEHKIKPIYNMSVGRDRVALVQELDLNDHIIYLEEPFSADRLKLRTMLYTTVNELLVSNTSLRRITNTTIPEDILKSIPDNAIGDLHGYMHMVSEDPRQFLSSFALKFFGDVPVIDPMQVSIGYSLTDDARLKVAQLASRNIYVNADFEAVIDPTVAKYRLEIYPSLPVKALHNTLPTEETTRIITDGIDITNKSIVIMHDFDNPSVVYGSSFVSDVVNKLLSKADSSYGDYISYYS